MAVTGYGQEEDRRRCWDAGFDHHLTKPVGPGFLDLLLIKSPVASAYAQRAVETVRQRSAEHAAIDFRLIDSGLLNRRLFLGITPCAAGNKPGARGIEQIRYPGRRNRRVD